jgi:hypothetical protein
VTIAPEQDPTQAFADQIAKHPAALIPFVRCFDSEDLVEFQFGKHGWEFQVALVKWWMDNDITMVLKARQIGITWLAGMVALWHLEFQPGSRSLVFSINEEQASKAINRIWDLRESMPAFLRRTRVVKPSRNARPSTEIQVQHANGRISHIIAFPSSPKSGHGETAALVVLDEFARQDYARDTWKAVLPTASKGGRILGISTGNGVSQQSQGGEVQGNHFHHLYQAGKSEGETWYPHEDLVPVGKTAFLRYDLHPDRDEEWWIKKSIEMASPPDMGEQYPRNEREAFILTGSPYFDAEALDRYSDDPAKAEFRCSFEESGLARARLTRSQNGAIRVYHQPMLGSRYAIFADIATGRGSDFSAATVVNLNTLRFEAKIHTALGAEYLAEQLHYLGMWYNKALIAPEMGGGYGETVVVFLRDGKDGRPPYPSLYRHRQRETRLDLMEHKPFGFPMNTKTRPLVLGGLKRAIHENVLPELDSESVGEYQTFVYRKTNPSPRAQEGCNDDRVFADAGAIEMYRQFGTHDRQWRSLRKEPEEQEYQPLGAGGIERYRI